MKTFRTIEASATLKGMAKHTYNRVMSAMAEDSEPSMCHTFAVLTEGAKSIALQSGKFSNLYVRGERKGMTAEEAAKELTERAAGCVSRKLRKIDMICAVAFLAEYISRQRKAIETPETPNPDNTPSTMNASEIVASLNEKQVRAAAAKLLPAKFFDEYFTPECGNIALIRDMLEDHVFEYDMTATEIMEAAGADENANETIPAAIIAELNTRKDRSAWDKGVTEYATELAESLDNWDNQPESIEELHEMMLNGADDWKAYSWGGCSLIYNQDIAERLCSPSELKRVTNKNGLRDYPNSREHWLDVQARALYQAANRVTEIANKFFNA